MVPDLWVQIKKEPQPIVVFPAKPHLDNHILSLCFLLCNTPARQKSFAGPGR